jgi:Conjugative transposon, TraM
MENSVNRSEKLPQEESNSIPSQDENLLQAERPKVSLKALIATFLRKKKWLLIIVGALLFLYSMFRNVQSGTDSVFSFNVPLPDMVKTNEAMARQQEAAARNQRIGANGDVEKQKIDTIQVSSYSVNYGTYHKTKANENSSKDVPNIATTNEISTPSLTKNSVKISTISKVLRSRTDNKREKNDTIIVQKEENAFNTTVISTAKINEKSISTKKSDYIKAAIYGNQLLRSGSTVRIRLLEPLQINGEYFPTNSIGTGIAMLNGSRVIIAISSFKLNQENRSIKLLVFDKDLLPGIAFMGSDKVKEGIRNNGNESLDRLTDNALYNLPYGSVLGAGADLAKGISRSLRYGAIQKKMGEIELEEGYKVFLKIEQ